MNSLHNSIISTFKKDWFGTQLDNLVLNDVVSELLDTKLRGWKLHDHLTETFSISDGAAQTLIEIVKDFKKVSNTPRRSAQEARIDRILRTRNSDGKATSRKF